MEHLGVEIDMKNSPLLDKQFMPISLFRKGFLASATKPVAISVERNNGLRAVYDTYITGENEAADRYYIERLVKTLLWIKGGFKVAIYGDNSIAAYIKETYGKDGARAFDNEFMSRIYEREFEVVSLPLSEKPTQNERSMTIGGNFSGCRIGFDAGGSDRKVSAVIDGTPVYSEEVVWCPKIRSDPEYHFSEIVKAFNTAAEKMPRVDAIGVSSAGIYIDNRTMAASLFLKVPPEAFEQKVKDIYIRAAKEIGDVPVQVVNDGDVTALAGALELKGGNILGIAMGTSEASGYVDKDGNITGWLNELAFAPVDVSENAMEDEWSGDIGCGVKYFSQDGVIKLAVNAGIEFDANANLTPGEKLKFIQNLLEEDSNGGSNQDCSIIRGIFESIGYYLGHTLPYYNEFYNQKCVLLLGRVMSGEGGNIIVRSAEKVLREEYPECDFVLHIPDEKNRRVGQSVAAASL